MVKICEEDWGRGDTVKFDAILPVSTILDEIILTPEQEAEAEWIEDNLKAAATVEIRRIARLLASKKNRHLFGKTEFQVRDRPPGGLRRSVRHERNRARD